MCLYIKKDSNGKFNKKTKENFYQENRNMSLSLYLKNESKFGFVKFFFLHFNIQA